MKHRSIRWNSRHAQRVGLAATYIMTCVSVASGLTTPPLSGTAVSRQGFADELQTDIDHSEETLTKEAFADNDRVDAGQVPQRNPSDEETAYAEYTKHAINRLSAASIMVSASLGSYPSRAAGEKASLLWLSRSIRQSFLDSLDEAKLYHHVAQWNTSEMGRSVAVTLTYDVQTKTLSCISSRGTETLTQNWRPILFRQIHQAAGGRNSLAGFGPAAKPAP